MKLGVLSAILASASALSIPGIVWEKIGLHGPSEELRLLEFADGQEWHSEDDKWKLRRQGRKFIDVTDHVGHYEQTTEAASVVTFPDDMSFKDEVSGLSKNISKDNLESTLTEFSGFYTRYYKSDKGLDSSLWLHERVKDISKGRDDITVRLVDHEWQQKSLIASIKGTKRPDEIVIVGAHQDSINLLMPSILPAPGADDDGSGTVTTLEVFRVLVENGFTPENTVEFHWYSAEEGGLLGSQDVFTAYSGLKKNVKAMLQQDMTGFSKRSIEQDGHDSLGVITDYVHPGLTTYIKKVVDTYCDIPYVETECGYACSDHASAAKVGYPSAFVIESGFKASDPYIHSTMDTIDRLDFDHMAEHCKLTLAFAYELGNFHFSN